MKIPTWVQTSGRYVVAHAPAFLTGFGLFSFGVTIAFGIQATPKACQVIEELKAEYEERGEEVPKTAMIRKVLPIYIPTILAGGVTATCMIASTSISAKRQSLAAAASVASELALKEYQAKVIEEIGEKKEGKILDAIAKDHIDKNPASQNTVIMTGKGESLCYDSWSGRYFKTDYEKVRGVANSVNRDVINDMWVSMNDMYYYLGLPPIESGRDVGFDVDHLLEFRFSSHMTDDGQPAMVLEYIHQPRPRY